MFNKNRFKAILLENDITLKELAKMLNMSKTTLYRKINGDSDFYRNEIISIGKVIGKKNADIIFFD